MKKSMVRQVTEIIAQRGPSTLDDIAPLLPDVPREKGSSALQNARNYGMLYIYAYGERPFGQRGGKSPATYAAVTEGKKPPPVNDDPMAPRGFIPNVNSVWGLAAA